jgi:hypothetical protein
VLWVGAGRGSVNQATIAQVESTDDAERVSPRVLAAAAAAWVVLYLVGYVRVIRFQQGEVAWWYTALVVISAVSCAGAAAGLRIRALLAIGLTTSVAATLLGLLSIGMFLAPCIVLLAIAVVLASSAKGGAVAERSGGPLGWPT